MEWRGRMVLVAALVFGACMVSARAAWAVDPCSLLTTAEVSAALGATAGPGKAVTPKYCQWTAPGKDGGSEKVAVTISDAQRFAMAKTPVNSPSITKTPVSGVGDEAVFGTTAGRAASMTVKKGDNYFAVSLMGVPMGSAQAVATALAKDVAAKL